ncbi:MAG: hypothetical protein LBV04_05945 [Deferribacteraceae bacterium]|nr:hypothetical protein [Deferribacteraceae bacterium]
MRDNKINYDFKPEVVGGGFSQTEKKFKDEFQKNPKQKIEIIWVDKDIYLREQDLQDQYAKKLVHMPDFMFNYMNFEDFLVMHLDIEILNEWESFCNANNHFTMPMTAATYEPLLREHIFKDYKKGSLPKLFAITQDSLIKLFRHNKDNKIPFRSDFADFLENILAAQSNGEVNNA